MSYVMVPVPEEFVEEVMQFILRSIARASIEPWDEAALNELFTSVDEPSRSLLAFVARATLGGTDLSEPEAIQQMQLNGREITAIMNELNGAAREAERPNLLSSRVITERLPNGRTTDKRIFLMEYDVAELVQAAERADARAHGDPVGEVAG